MTSNLSLLLDFSLQERAFHELAKACWGDYSMPIETCQRDNIIRTLLSEGGKYSHLLDHKKAVLEEKVFTIFPSTMPNTVRYKLKVAVLRLLRGYREALACTKAYEHTHGLFDPHPLMAGPYSAKNFIDPSGHFDELAWAKRFVSDDEISVYSRFELACFFCFEETIRELWSSVKNEGRSRYEGSLFNSIRIYGFPVIFWVYQLEGKLVEFYSYIEPNGFFSIYFHGFKEAVDRSNEYAARYFWAYCTGGEKELFINTNTFQFIPKMMYFVRKQNPGILNFVYSLLPSQRKDCLGRRHAQILSCLLHSSFYKTVLNDILRTSFHSAFPEILKDLSEEMMVFPFLEYEETFFAIWEHLNKAGILYINRFTPAIRNLIVIKAEPLLSKIIQPLRHEDKLSLLRDRVLWNRNEILWNGNYDLFHRFLMCFVIDLDPVTQTFSLKRESITDLCSIVETRIRDETRERPASATVEMIKVVENIRESFEVLDNLLSHLDE